MSFYNENDCLSGSFHPKMHAIIILSKNQWRRHTNSQGSNYNISFTMKNLVLIGLLAVLALQDAVLLSSSTSNTIITFPTGLTVVNQPYHTSNNLGFIGNGANWLWRSGGASWPDGYTLTFETWFYASCTSDATLIITADNAFSAKLNGGSTSYSGNDWTKIYKFTLSNLKCGVNYLVITVVNKDKNSPAALIFAVTQDQSNCYKCLSPLSYYDYDQCKCKCVKPCKNCNQISILYSYQDYPVCGCKCARVLICALEKYFNPYSCACECYPKACLPGYKQSDITCGCVKCVVQICPRGKKWDSSRCGCYDS